MTVRANAIPRAHVDRSTDIYAKITFWLSSRKRNGSLCELEIAINRKFEYSLLFWNNCLSFLHKYHFPSNSFFPQQNWCQMWVCSKIVTKKIPLWAMTFHSQETKDKYWCILTIRLSKNWSLRNKWHRNCVLHKCNSVEMFATNWYSFLWLSTKLPSWFFRYCCTT